VLILAEVGQVLIALGLSGAVVFWLGPVTFSVVALFVLVICTLLLFENALADGKPITAVTSVQIIMTAIAIGLIWPALPMIVGWGAWRHRADSKRERPE
jgi:hypothetical protein